MELPQIQRYRNLRLHTTGEPRIIDYAQSCQSATCYECDMALCFQRIPGVVMTSLVITVLMVGVAVIVSSVVLVMVDLLSDFD